MERIPSLSEGISSPCTKTMSWDPPPDRLVMSGGEVHLWRVPLVASRAAELRDILSPDERARAHRFHFERDRRRFIVARGSLRTILGQYLKKDPARLILTYSSYGKPLLAGEPDPSDLCFNLSHANELALVAVTRERQIGVDIEFIRPDFASERIAERFFSRQEVEVLRGLPAGQQAEAFFHCWTRKEAYIKALGEGMSMPLDQFSVSLAPASPAALLGNLRDAAEVSRWSLQDLSPGPGYVAAVAVEGDGWRLKCWQPHWPKPAEQAKAIKPGA